MISFAGDGMPQFIRLELSIAECITRARHLGCAPNPTLQRTENCTSMVTSNPHRDSARPLRAAIVVEQTLGHVTYGQNLLAVLDNHSTLVPTFIFVPYEMSRWARHIPGYSNWTVRSGIRARRAIREHLRRSEIDVMFVHTHVPALLLGRSMRRIPTVVSLDATSEQYDQLGVHYAHATASPFIERWKKRAAKRCFARAKHIVAWSDWVRDGLINGYEVDPARITVIGPGVNIQQWERDDRCRDDTVVRVLFVGGDLHRKGAPLLIEAARRLRADSSVPAFEVHLVTTSQVDPEPGLIVHNSMKPNSPELIALYHSSHIFCLPTLADCLPMVLCEAGVVGLAVIATDVGAIREIVVNEHTGLLVAPSVDAVEAALRRVISDPELRTRLGVSAEELVRSRFDARANGLRLGQILVDVGSPVAAS